jgi:hypothetical protein
MSIPKEKIVPVLSCLSMYHNPKDLFGFLEIFSLVNTTPFLIEIERL